jgi:ParB-like chromosome segregation protein Spo0J
VRIRRSVRWVDARFVARPKRRRRAEIDARPFHAGAADALRLAMAWAAEIGAGVATRASIARREGLSRARVTQLMRLLGLEGRLRTEILDGSRVCSVRGLLRLA